MISRTLRLEWERLGAWRKVSGKLLGCILKLSKGHLIGKDIYDGWGGHTLGIWSWSLLVRR